MRRLWLRGALLPLAITLLACRSTQADRLDTIFEKAIGRFVEQQAAGPFGTETDPLLANYVNRIGGSVAAQSPRKDIRCKFVITGSDVANAYTLPGGYILVTRGMLDTVDSDDELASLLAHEVGHVEKRHATEQIEFNLGLALLQRFLPAKALGANGNTLLSVYGILRTLNKSKEQEAEADEEGIKFAYAAGYDPRGLVQFFGGLGGYQNRIEDYFATHPSPEKRIAAANRSPLVTRPDAAQREHVAEGYEARGLPGLAAVARTGGDTVSLPPLLPVPPLPEDFIAERKQLDDDHDAERRALLKFYNIEHAASIAQQFLVLNTQLADPRWIYLSSRAYSVQAKITDVYSRSARLLNTAPGAWEELSRESLASAPGTTGEINGAIGRGETLRALDVLRGVATPLSHAQAATASVLLDLNNRFVRANDTTMWVRYGAEEGMLRYAESELARADARSGAAWRLLSLARIRRYETRLNELVPENDPGKRTLWQNLLQRQIGSAFPTNGPTGSATVRAMIAVSLSMSATDAEAKRDPADTDADWVLHTGTVAPENVATALRILTLQLERELNAEKR